MTGPAGTPELSCRPGLMTMSGEGRLFNLLYWALPHDVRRLLSRARYCRLYRSLQALRQRGLSDHQVTEIAIGNTSNFDYLLAGNGIVRRHHRLGQGIGTGFPGSRRCLYREVARGVDWIFSNRAAAMQAICTERTPADF